MPETDRRSFLQTGGMALFGLALPAAVRPAAHPSAPPTLVCLFLRGGVDGLSMVIPHGDPRYYRARPRTAIPAADVIDLDGYFGLHPGLAPLKPYWDAGRLTVVPAGGVGVPQIARSHVEAQDRIDAALADAGAVTVDTLDDAAGLIRSGAAPRLAVVNAGGWDTHVNQGSSEGRLATRLRKLGLELAAFAHGLGERARDVTVLTVSEFGRTIGENRNGGTDHGRATAMLVLGRPMHARGVWGRWPGLEGTDVAVTTDVRALLS